MSTLFEDTTQEAENAQISLLRKAGFTRRASLANALTRQVVSLSKRAIARANPDLSPTELGLRFVSLHYGEDLARRVRLRIKGRVA